MIWDLEEVEDSEEAARVVDADQGVAVGPKRLDRAAIASAPSVATESSIKLGSRAMS